MKRLQIFDSVKRACEIWGEQKFVMLNSDAQGWNAKSLLARVHELHDGASSRSQRVTQFREEAHTGDGLLVVRAIRGVPPQPPIPADLHDVLYLHYVVRGAKAKEKAERLQVSVSTYWNLLSVAEAWIAARMPALEGSAKHEAT